MYRGGCMRHVQDGEQSQIGTLQSASPRGRWTGHSPSRGSACTATAAAAAPSRHLLC